MRLWSCESGVGRNCARIALGFLFVSFTANAADLAIAVDGPPVTVAPEKPGQPLRLAFRAQAGQRLGLGVTALKFVPASATGVAFTVKQPDGQAVRGLEMLNCFPAGAEGACDGEFTVAATGTHVIDVDVPFSAAPRFSIQISSAVSRSLAIGKGEAVALSRPGQDAWFALTVEAGQDVAVGLRDVASGDRNARFSLRIHRPDGSLVGEAGAHMRLGASLPLGGGAPAGTYRVEVDPDRGATGSFVVAATVTPQAPDGALDIASGVNEELRFAFSAGDGQSASVGLDNIAHTPDVDSESRLLVVGPDGKRLNTLYCRTRARGQPVPCKVKVADLKAGRYTIVVSPPPGASVSGTLYRTQDHTAKLDPDSPNRIDLRQAGQVARYRFAGKAGERMGVAIARNVTDDKSRVFVTLLGPPDAPTAMRGTGLLQASVQIPAFELPVTGTYTLLVDAGFRTVSVTVSLIH
jgi:hypothetical protein